MGRKKLEMEGSKRSKAKRKKEREKNQYEGRKR